MILAPGTLGKAIRLKNVSLSRYLKARGPKADGLDRYRSISMSQIGNGIRFERFVRQPKGNFWAAKTDKTEAGNPSHHTCTTADTMTAGNPGHHTCTTADTMTAGSGGHHTCTTADTTTAGSGGHHTCTTADTATAGSGGHHTCTTADTATANYNGWQISL